MPLTLAFGYKMEPLCILVRLNSQTMRMPLLCLSFQHHIQAILYQTLVKPLFKYPSTTDIPCFPFVGTSYARGATSTIVEEKKYMDFPHERGF